MLTALSLSSICIASIVFFSRRLLCYLRHFQEGKYSRKYFKDWVIENGVYDKKGTLIAAAAAFCLEFLGDKHEYMSVAISLIAAGLLISLGYWEIDPRITGIPTLKTTNRATTIYNLALALYSVAFTLSIWTIYMFSNDDDLALHWLAVIVAIQSSPIWLIIARTLLFHRRYHE